MPLKAIVDKLEDVLEPQRSLYVERNGKFVLDAEGVEDVSGLKSALEAERKRAAAAEKLAKGYEGLDPVVARQAMVDKAKADEDKQRAAGNFDQMKAQMLEQHNLALQAKDAQIAKREAFIRKTLAENVARQALEGPALSVDLLIPHVMASVSVVEDETTGGWSAQVLDPKGMVRVDGSGNPMTIAALVEEMRGVDRFKPAFRGSGANGSGAPAQQGRPATGATVLARGDNAGFLANLEKISKGEVTVAPA